MKNRIQSMLLTAAVMTLSMSQAYAADLVITNARLIDGTGADPVNGVNIVVSGGRITSVGTDDVNTRAAEVIDAAGKTVMPGLSELHVHSSLQFLIPDEAMEGGFGYPKPEWAITSDEDMQRFIDEDFATRMMKFLDTGVTTIVDPGSYFPWIIQMRDKVRSGEVTGPNMYVTGRLFTAPGGHPASTVCNSHPWCVETITVATDDPEVAREGVRMLVEGGVDGLKMVYDGTRDDVEADEFEGMQRPHLRKEVMEAVIDEGHKQGVKVLAHTFAIIDTYEVVNAGIDGLVHASMRQNGSFTTPDGGHLPTLMNRFDVPMTTTIRFAATELDDMPPEIREQMQGFIDNIGPSLREMADAGVTLMFGTDFEGIGMDPQPRELIIDEARALMNGGFSEMEVIVMATGNAAKHPLTPDDMGVIKAGNVADLIILENDPLENIEAMTHPQIVVLAGDVVVDKR